MYFYQSHLGGIYASKELYDSDRLYCDECGDSDWYLGEANTLDEAWELLKSETALIPFPCDDCPHIADPDNQKCDTCELGKAYDKSSGGYSVTYVMDMLTEYFEIERPTYVYMIELDNTKSACVVRWVKKRNDEEKQQHEIPHCFCYDDSLKDMIAHELLAYFGAFEDFTEEKEFELVSFSQNGIRYIVYIRKTSAVNNDYCEYYDNDWYGFVPIVELNPLPLDAPVLKHVQRYCCLKEAMKG